MKVLFICKQFQLCTFNSFIFFDRRWGDGEGHDGCSYFVDFINLKGHAHAQ